MAEYYKFIDDKPPEPECRFFICPSRGVSCKDFCCWYITCCNFYCDWPDLGDCDVHDVEAIYCCDTRIGSGGENPKFCKCLPLCCCLPCCLWSEIIRFTCWNREYDRNL